MSHPLHKITNLKKVVFIHGLLLSGWIFTRMQRYFSRQGYQCYVFNYPTRTQTIRQSAAELHQWLKKHDIHQPYMVCHSMGGLVSSRLLEEHVNSDHLPVKVVCLGSPFLGSMVAGKLAKSSAGRVLLGVQAESELVSGMQRWPDTCALGIIAGNKNIGAGRLLGLDPHKPGDGTVLVEETGIQGAIDHIILPVSHSQMTFSVSVFKQAQYFLEHNKFKHKTQ